MRKLTTLVALTLGLALAGAGCAKKKDEGLTDGGPRPVLQPGSMQIRNLADLMKYHASAVVSPQPWIGWWWPYTSAGVASGGRDPQGLSPADKYDQAYKNHLKALGQDITKYESVADWERSKHGPGLGYVAGWWGHCNGWSAASVMVPEPQLPKVVEGVEFKIRDLKAILAESWMEFSGDFVGTRVNDQGDFTSAAFWDVVPAQFQLILANVVSRQNRGIIIDRHTGHEIWNQPLVAYEIQQPTKDDYLGAHPSYPDIYRINMTARIWWANDSVKPDDVTPQFTLEQYRDTFDDYYFPGRKLHYELWLDGPVEFDGEGHVVKSGNILVTREDGRYVGGVWKNATNPAALLHTHPDYMWVPFGLQHSTGYKNPRIDDVWVKENIGAPHSGR